MEAKNIKETSYDIEITHNPVKDEIETRSCNLFLNKSDKAKNVIWKIKKGDSEIAKYVSINNDDGTFSVTVPANSRINHVLVGTIVINAVYEHEALPSIDIKVKINPEVNFRKKQHQRKVLGLGLGLGLGIPVLAGIGVGIYFGVKAIQSSKEKKDNNIVNLKYYKDYYLK